MLQVPQPDNFGSHLIWVALPVMLTTAAGQVLAYLANKRRGDEKDRKQQEIDREKEIRFDETLDNYNLHAHGEWRHDESTGPLRAENIRFPRRRGS